MVYSIETSSTSVLLELKKTNKQTNNKQTTLPPPPKNQPTHPPPTLPTPEKPDVYILILVVGKLSLPRLQECKQTCVCLYHCAFLPIPNSSVWTLHFSLNYPCLTSGLMPHGCIYTEIHTHTLLIQRNIHIHECLCIIDSLPLATNV